MSYTPLLPSNLQVVATRGYMPSGIGVGNGAARADFRLESRVKHTVGNSAVSRLCLGYAGYFVQPGSTPTPIGNDNGIAANIEETTPVSASWPLTFNNGEQFGRIPNGAIEIISDPQISMAVAAGGFLYSRNAWLIDSPGYNLPTLYGAWAETGIGDYQAYDANIVSQTNTVGTMSAPSSNTANIGCVPYMVLGVPATAMAAVGIFGDSIGFGQNDTPDATYGNFGYIPRGLESVNGFVVPWISRCVGSDKFALNVDFDFPQKLNSFKYVTHVVIEMGINDITAGTSLATMQTLLTNTCNKLKRIIGPYGKRLQIAVCCPLPSSSSTDSWATLGNQTTNSANPVRVTYIAWLKTQVGTLFDALIDATQYVESVPGTSGLWIVNGTANYATSDGAHPSTAACILAAQAVNAWALTIAP